MPELHLIEDEAVRYVLGELTAAERREFEARLAESAELRALVRELEQGAVALSMALPQRRPPQEVWMQIENVVARDARREIVIPAFWTGWWRSGWAAAAACLAAWVFYGVWANRSGPSHTSPESVASGVTSHRAATVAESDRGKTENATRQTHPADNDALRE